MPKTAHYSPFTTHRPGARLYHSTASVWLSVDPLSDNTPGVTPYAYCVNNPIRIIDPDGRDWYESEDGKTLEFIYGESGKRPGFTNIGKELSRKYCQKLDNGEYSTLTVSVNFSKDEFVSQMDSKGNKIMECVAAANKMSMSRGGKKTSYANELYVTYHNNEGRATTGIASKLIAGANKTMHSLLRGIPVVAGMDYREGSPNYDAMTDHYVAIISMSFFFAKSENGDMICTGGSMLYANPGSISAQNGLSPSNKFTFSTNDYKASNGNRILTNLRVL